MEAEVATIKLLLIVILIVLCITTISVLFREISSFIAYQGKKERVRSNEFTAKAYGYLERCEYDELEEHSKNRINTYPNDYSAYFFLGKAHFYKKNYPKAKENFDKVLEIEPALDDVVGYWIYKIDEIMSVKPKLVK
ncbi:MAG: tetratricopeptide repeat protein [Sedimenticola sp.]